MLAKRWSLERLHFVPAELDGAPVPQVFDFGVDFGFTGDPFRLKGDNVVTVRATPAS